MAAAGLAISPADTAVADIDLDVDPAGLTFVGSNNTGMSRHSIQSADINADGQLDVLLGDPTMNFSPGNSAVGGGARVLFGPFPGPTVDVLTHPGFAVNGYEGRGYGRSVDSLGDVNADGYGDFVVASTTSGVAGGCGATVLIFGKASTGAVDIQTMTGADGVRFNLCEPTNPSYVEPINAGDVNGDGITDLAIANFTSRPFVGSPENAAGAVFVVFGKTTWPAQIDLEALGADGYRINGKAGSQLGYAVTAVGDVNGDGLDDIATTAPAWNSDGFVQSSAAFVLFGKTDTATVTAANLGAGGFKIDFVGAGPEAGSSVQYPDRLDDVTNDGIPDLLLSDPQTGVSWVIYGKADTATINVATLGTNGFTISGINEDVITADVIGDVNNDGTNDLFIGTSETPRSASSPRHGYVVTAVGEGGDIPLPVPASRGSRVEPQGTLNQFINSGPLGDLNGDGTTDFYAVTTSWDGSVPNRAVVLFSTVGEVGSAIDDSYAVLTTVAAELTVADNDTGFGTDANITVITGASHGTVTVNDGGAATDTLTYLSTGSYSGPDTFTYEICASDGSPCGTATVVVDVSLGCTITGTSAPDTLTGTSGDDVICGLGGADAIDGGDGNDLIFAGTGPDSVSGGAGVDRIYGEGGVDTIDGGNGDDDVRGGAGADILSGGAGADLIYGVGGNDTIDGGIGDDLAFGGTGDDTLNLGDGNDIGNGGTGNDTINGEAGRDTMRGNDNNDTLDGGPGNDLANGGPSVDVCTAERLRNCDPVAPPA